MGSWARLQRIVGLEGTTTGSSHVFHLVFCGHLFGFFWILRCIISRVCHRFCFVAWSWEFGRTLALVPGDEGRLGHVGFRFSAIRFLDSASIHIFPRIPFIMLCFPSLIVGTFLCRLLNSSAKQDNLLVAHAINVYNWIFWGFHDSCFWCCIAFYNNKDQSCSNANCCLLTDEKMVSQHAFFSGNA